MSHLCPTDTTFERSYDAADPEVTRWTAECPRCLARAEALQALGELARGLPSPGLTDAQRRSIRAAVVAEPATLVAKPATLVAKPATLVAEPTTSAPAWRRPAVLVSVLAAGLLVGVGAWLSVSDPAPATETLTDHARAQVYAHADARWARMGPPQDEIVRLSQGKVSVEVPHLGAGRFRVITGDSEVEVRGTAFDVEAEHDRLLGVRVMRGRVAVRVQGQPEVTLDAGGRWTRPAPVAASAPAAVEPPDAAMAVAEPAEPVAVAAAPPRRASSGAAPNRRRDPEPRAKRAGRAPTTTHDIAPRPVDVAPQPVDPPLDPGEALWRTSWAALRRGDHGAAAAGFDRLLATFPDHALAEDAAWWSAMARVQSGDDGRAALLRFEARFPASARAPEAHYRLGAGALAAGDLDDAERWLGRAARAPQAHLQARAEAALRQVAARRRHER